MRNSELMKKRDHHLIMKFHELYNIRRQRIEDAIRETSEAFYLDESYTYKRIFYNKDNRLYYEQLVDQLKKTC